MSTHPQPVEHTSNGEVSTVIYLPRATPMTAPQAVSDEPMVIEIPTQGVTAASSPPPVASAAPPVVERDEDTADQASPSTASAGDEGGIDLPAPPKILPWWCSTPARAKDTARWAVRYALHVAGFHAARGPQYGLRMAWWVARGMVIAPTKGVGWVSAIPQYRPMIEAVKAQGRKEAQFGPDRWQEIRELMAERAELSQRRLRVTLIWTFLLGIAVTAGVLAVGSAFVWGLGAVAAFVLAKVGRPAKRERFTDVIEMPVRLELSTLMLTSALRATGLVKADVEPQLVTPILRDGTGWSVVFDLPRGGGKTAADVIGKRDELAAELGVDEIQVIMNRVRASGGGHAGRVALWVADDDPYLGEKNHSPLITAETFSVWDPIPYGRDARGRPITVSLMWQSMFFGGLPRRGKTFAQRLASAAAVLDPFTQHWVADGKGGADWMPMRAVAHRLVIGAEEEALAQFTDMLDELIEEMGRRFAFFGTLPTSVCPQGKLTPEISRRYKLPVIFITIDELQEYLDSMDTKTREETIKKLCRLARRAPAAGFILNAASQRPDAESVPTKLREIITYRYSTQVVDRTSSDMVLGKGKAAQGADASMLSEEHVGVGVLVTGPASFEIMRCDYMDNPAFVEVCQRGRVLRQKAGMLTGDAAGDTVAAAEAAGVRIDPALSDVLLAMHGVDRMHTTTILNRLSNMDEDRYADWTPERLADALERAGVVRTSKQVKIGGTNLAGYRRADLEAAVPAGALMPAPAPAAPATTETAVTGSDEVEG